MWKASELERTCGKDYIKADDVTCCQFDSFWPGICMEGSGIFQSAENVHGHNVQQDIPSKTSKEKEVDSSGLTWTVIIL